MSIPFACTTPDCDEVVDVPEGAVKHDEWFDPEDVVCPDCAEALVPDDVKSMRPAPVGDVANWESFWTTLLHDYEKWSTRKAANKVKTTADWHLYQRAMWDYEGLLAEQEGA